MADDVARRARNRRPPNLSVHRRYVIRVVAVCPRAMRVRTLGPRGAAAHGVVRYERQTRFDRARRA